MPNANFAFVTMEEMMVKAMTHKFALPHINSNNLEWTKAILLGAQEAKSPLIIAFSQSAIKYQCGFKNIYDMVKNVATFLDITIPVVLHLDHGNFEHCLAAIDAGFTSVMFDGSHLPFAENLAKTKAIIKHIGNRLVSLETEIGTIGGEEDGIIGLGELADVKEAQIMAQEKISALAAGIGNIHGVYPENWQGLNYELLQQLATLTKKGIVLHGGSGIPDADVQKAIQLGIRKVNVNTECQLAFQAATRAYILANKDLDMAHKGYDPRKLLNPGYLAIKDKVVEKIKLFGANNQA